MPYHVEISSSLRHARAFNLGEAELRAIVEPWLAGRPVELGDREWEPAKSALKVLEGPALELPELAYGQGWSNAGRSAENVTRSVLAAATPQAAPAAFLLESDAPREAATEIAAAHGGRKVDWREAQRRVDGRDPEVAAVILVTRRRGREEPASGARSEEETRSEP